MAGTARGHDGHAQQGFHGGAELVTEGAARGVLHHDQILGEFQAQAGRDHQSVQMNAHGFGVDDHLALIIDIRIAHVRLNGQMGLALASIYLIPQRIVMWSAGVSYFTKGSNRKQVIKRVLTHPCIVAVFLGLALMLTGMKLPSFLDAALKDIGNCNTAMSMLVIGTILAEVKPKQMLDKSVLPFCGWC